MVKAVIFDVDGTLIDSVDLHAQAWQETFLKHGIKADFQEVCEQIGKGGDKLMKVFLSEEQIARLGEEIEEERAKLFKREYLPQIKPFPGLHGLFARLRKDGIEIALASSAKDDELEVYKKLTGIEPFLAEDTSSDEVPNSKPDPDVFRAAVKKLGIDPRDVVAVGDTKFDAESAGRAGMFTIGLLCGGSSPATLRAAGCSALYRDPADLLKNYDTSPLAPTETRSELFQAARHPGNKENRLNLDSPLYFLMGIGIGIAVGMLFAPKSGLQTRNYLRPKSEEGKEHARRAASDAAALAKLKARQLRKNAIDVIERGKHARKAPLGARNLDANRHGRGITNLRSASLA